MGKFVKGDIVIIPFPFTDLSGSKKRPAFVVTDLSGDDIIRPNKIFTADKNCILSVAGHLGENKIRNTLNAIIAIISS